MRKEINYSDDTLRQNLQRLIQVRWWVIGGELLMLAIAYGILEMPQTWRLLALVLGLQVLVNVISLWRFSQKSEISAQWFLGQICLDVVLLLGLFYVTGGAANPFVYLLLLPLLISVAILPRRYVSFIAVLVVLGYGWLIWGYQQRQGAHMMGHHGHAEQFDWHVLGMWLGFVFGVGIVLFFVLRMADSLRQRDLSLAQAREQALRDEQLVTLGTLAAGAAHELGTPLATMAVLIRELSLEYAGNQDLAHELAILRQQIDRCKQTLSMLSVSAGQLRAEEGLAQRLDEFMASLVESWQVRHPNKTLDYAFISDGAAPYIIAEQRLRQALLNLLDNAAQSSRQLIALNCRYEQTALWISIEDDGPGLPEHLLPYLGKAPVTTRVEGHGLGLLLANAVIQRLGGEIQFLNRAQGGTQILVKLALDKLETEQETQDV